MRSIVLLSALTLSAATAQTPAPAPPLNELLRDGLYAEEVSRDSEAAAKNYGKILAQAEAEQPYIANALFRLAEIRRKQDRKDEAITLYQRLLTRYSDVDPQAKLSREALAKLGVAGPSPTPLVDDDESREVQRLEKLLQSSPDVLSKEEFFKATAEKGWEKPVAFLLDHGADKNSVSLSIGLEAAAAKGHLGIVNLLLKRGVDAKTDMADGALREATTAGNEAVVKTLLEAGVDPNRSLNIPLLGLAVSRYSTNMVDLFLAHGANPNLNTNYQGSALQLAAKLMGKSSEPMVLKLLKHGGDLKLPSNSGVLKAAAVPDNLSTLRLLLDRGAFIDPDWEAHGFLGAGPQCLAELLRRRIFPAWQGEERVRIIAQPYKAYLEKGDAGNPIAMTPEMDFRKITPILADKAKGDSIRSLADLVFRFGGVDNRTPAVGLKIFRRTPDGGYTSIDVPLTAPDPYPDLQWGDILLVETKTDNRSGSSGWTPEINLALRQHVVIPLEIECEGTKQSLTLRGDRLSYDPSEPVAPLVTAVTLKNLLMNETATLEIHREGLQEPIRPTNDNDCWLAPGDRVVIHDSGDREGATSLRRRSVVVKSPGLLFEKWFDAGKEASPPTLFQAVAELYAVPGGLKNFKPPVEIAKFLQASFSTPFNLLDGPDLSNIRIRRLSETGQDEIIPVDLTNLAARCTEGSDPAEVRKLDRELLPGDIVEIPVLPKSDTPWNGFSDAEKQLLVKALSVTVQVKAGNISQTRSLSYSPPGILRTPWGPFTIPGGTGASRLSALNLLSEDFTNPRQIILTRNGISTETVSDDTYLREGDIIEIKPGFDQRRGTSPAQSGVRPPRARIIPSTPAY